MQKLIVALLQGRGPVQGTDATDVLAEDKYDDLMETASAMPTALTEDLDTRRRKSLKETWRSRWHTKAGKDATARIDRASEATWLMGGQCGAPQSTRMTLMSLVREMNRGRYSGTL